MADAPRFDPRTVSGMQMLVAMCEYLTKAGWKRSGDGADPWWDDPHPELRRVHSSTQDTYRAVHRQIRRDLGEPEDDKI